MSGRSWLRLTGRGTNLALFTTLLVAYLTGAAADATGSPRGWWVATAHGAVGLLLLLLVPWKKRVVQHGLRRARASRWLSMLMGVLALITVAVGVGSATGLVSRIAGFEGKWVHTAAALVLAPLVVWHALARPARPRRTDLSRRTFLRAGVLSAGGLALLGASEVVIRWANLPGAARRFTGSHERGSLVPASMPSTVWLDDTAPAVDAATWRLTVVDAAGVRRLDLDALSRGSTTQRAVLDCTSGWYAEQDWTGTPVSDLLPDVGEAHSLVVHSLTGYSMRFPVSDLPTLLLATDVGGGPLARRHGYPLRLVAPGRRGFWWVKWVDRIELDSTPPWWRPPFPLT